MKKRILSMLLTIVMVVGLVPAAALSAFAVDETTLTDTWDGSAVTVKSAPDVDLPDNDELFAGYVEQMFSPWGGVSFFGTAAGARLSGAPAELYNLLKGKIEKVAAGEIASTEFSLTNDELKSLGAVTSFTAADLGVSSIIENDTIADAASNAANAKFFESISFDTVVAALLHDCPYELYWYDKVTGAESQYQLSSNGINLNIVDFSVTFNVAENYRNGTATTFNTSIVENISKAKAKAEEIVNANNNKSDYEKLVAYRDAICSLVSYNTDAAASGNFSTDNDPWQLIYVFDGKEDTKVVCEGYAKAFQYLCDCGGLTCYTVSGTMSSGTDVGPHMWNIVTLNGANYLVDVTNSDEGSVGQDGKLLFLVGGTIQNLNGTDSNGTPVTIPAYVFGEISNQVIYYYGAETTELWGTDADSILTLATSNYVNDSSEPNTHIDADNSGRCDNCNTLMQPAKLCMTSISLNGNIALNYYMLLSDEVLADETAYMQFTMADGEIIRIPVSKGEKRTVDGETYYVFSCAVNAKEMTDDVVSRFVYNGGPTQEFTYNIKQYADYILKDSEGIYKQKDKELVTAMLNYGATAQTYFDYNTEKLANDGQTAPDYNFTIEGFDAVSGQGTDLAKFYSASLLLKSETTLRFFFQVNESVTDFTATYKGQTLEVKPRDGLYYVDVVGIFAKDLDENVTITIKDGTNTEEVSFSPMAYCQLVLKSNTVSQNMKDLAAALYLYNQAANTYFKEN